MTRYNEEKAALKVLYWVIFFIQLVPLLMFGGYTLQRLWFWYVVPLGVPALGLAQAMGLRIIFSFIVARADNHAKEEEEKDYAWEFTKIIMWWFLAAFALFEGWIISHWLTS